MANESITHRMSDDLRRQIQNGSLGPGALLPSEPELAREYEVSRQTARVAQRGFDDVSVANLKYSQGDDEIYSHENRSKILPENLSEIIGEAADPDELNNLYFSISQDSPTRRVDIQIGSGDWTTYLVESEDQTWAYGRYHELTERLLANRSLYAKGSSARPEVLQKGRGDKWRPAAWELTSDWRANAVAHVVTMLWFVLAIEITPIAVSLVYYLHPTNTKVGRTDQYNASQVLQWLIDNSSILFFVTAIYILMVVFLRRRLKSYLRSKVILKEVSFLSQLSFRRNRDDAVQLIILYLTFLLLIVGIVALLLQ